MLPRCAASTLLPRSLAVLVLLATGCPKRGSGGPPQHYDDPKAMIAVFEAAQRDEWQQPDRVVKALPIERRDMVLADIGAGSGYFTFRFIPHVGARGRVYAIDVEVAMISAISQKMMSVRPGALAPILARPDDPYLPAGGIDLVFICDTYHHFEFPLATMRSIHKALKPRGQVVLIDFHRIKGVSSEWAMSHVRAGQEVFVQEIVDAGFKQVEEKKDMLKESYFLRFERVNE